MREYKDASDVLDKPQMPPELVKSIQEIKGYTEALDSKDKATQLKITNAILKFEEHNTKHTADLLAYKAATAAAEKKAADAEDRVKGLETKIATGGLGHNGGPKMDPHDSPEFKSFYGMFCNPDAKSKEFENASQQTKQLALERKDMMLRTDDLRSGGYLVPPSTDSIIYKRLTEMSPVRLFATVRHLPGKSMNMVTRTNTLDSFYEGETEEAQQSANKYDEDTVTTYRQAVKVVMTVDQLMFSAVNMEAEIADAVSESFAVKESYLTLKGDGIKKPQGCQADPRVLKDAQVTALAGKLSFDDIAELISSLKSGYDPFLAMHRKTFGMLLQIKDSMGRPVWAPVQGDKPATIWDTPYTSSFIAMDPMKRGPNDTNAVSGSVPMMCCDLRRGYQIFDTVGMSVIRDDITEAGRALIKYNFRRYSTAKVVMPEAIKLLKVA
jgi:HK97 family phage major capsid protein